MLAEAMVVKEDGKRRESMTVKESVLWRDEITTAQQVIVCDVNTVLVGIERMKLHA